MSNWISFDGRDVSDDGLVRSFRMSNGGTDVFLNVLALSGAVIARTESEKRLMVYLSEKDQMVVGRGCVGFDLVEMPWERETFEEDQRFLIQVIDGARNKIGWEKLEYCPNEEIVFYYLDMFEGLVSRMTADDIREDFLRDWLAESEEDDPIYCDFPRCKKHNTFLTCFGCQICNS